MAADADDTSVGEPQRTGPSLAADPRAEKPELANTVRTMFFQARDYRRQLVSRWRAHYLTLNNRTPVSGPDSGQPAVRIAKVWPIVASMVAWMTDQRPVTQVAVVPEAFSPYADFYQQLATQMNTVMSANWSEYQMDAELSMTLWDMATYGIGWMKAVWEPHLADGLGDAASRRCDPYTIYPDPFARSPRSMGHIIEAKTVTVDDLDRAYPGSKKLLGMEVRVEDVDEAPHQLDASISPSTPRANLSALAPSTDARYTTSSRNTGTKSQLAREVPTVTMLEAWIREHTIEDTDDPTVKKVIDRWRCIVVVGNLVLFDHYADECSAVNDHPYDRLVLFDTGEMYGPSLVDFLTSPQQAINRTLAAIEHNVMLMGNPMIVESPRSQSRQQQITNRPGQRIKATPGVDMQWLNPPQMQPQIVVQLMQYYDSQIETISGLSAIVRGFSPSGRNSQGVLDSVQDAAFVRIRATLREVERLLRGQGGKLVATIAEFYTEPRIRSMTGDDGQVLYQALRARHFYSLGDNKGERIPMRFTLRSDAGSTLPTSQQARAGDAMTLYGLGAIDTLELLKAMNWPNHGVVSARVMQQQAEGSLQPPGQRQASRA